MGNEYWIAIIPEGVCRVAPFRRTRGRCPHHPPERARGPGLRRTAYAPSGGCRETALGAGCYGRSASTSGGGATRATRAAGGRRRRPGAAHTVEAQPPRGLGLRGVRRG